MRDGIVSRSIWAIGKLKRVQSNRDEEQMWFFTSLSKTFMTIDVRATGRYHQQSQYNTSLKERPCFLIWSIRVILILFEICLYLLLLLPPCCPLPLYPCLLTVSALALSTTPISSSLHISSPSPSPLFSHIPLCSSLSNCFTLLLSHYTPFTAL